MKALLFGGAFNPVTRAHVELAQLALEKTGRECVIFLPSQSHYIEKDEQKNYALSEKQRLYLLKKCQESRPWMKVSHYDLDQESQPRTYQSLQAMKKEGYDCALLMGDDQFLKMESTWLYGENIAKEFGIVCLEREKKVLEEVKNHPFLMKLMPYVQVIVSPGWSRTVSSSQIRFWLQDMDSYKEELEKVLPFSLAVLQEVL
ncbi:hypothetical protein [Bulleidia extructa]|uniref:hypothetical protein n=1 Tax=Bulleidia extructa TaxID=118748 RepID=UPI003BF26329